MQKFRISQRQVDIGSWLSRFKKSLRLFSVRLKVSGYFRLQVLCWGHSKTTCSSPSPYYSVFSYAHLGAHSQSVPVVTFHDATLVCCVGGWATSSRYRLLCTGLAPPKVRPNCPCGICRGSGRVLRFLDPGILPGWGASCYYGFIIIPVPSSASWLAAVPGYSNFGTWILSRGQKNNRILPRGQKDN